MNNVNYFFLVYWFCVPKRLSYFSQGKSKLKRVNRIDVVIYAARHIRLKNKKKQINAIGSYYIYMNLNNIHANIHLCRMNFHRIVHGYKITTINKKTTH